MKIRTTTSGCGVNDALHILCFCTITQLRFERLCCGHRLCPCQMKNERKGQKPRCTMAEREGVSYCLYPELKENKNRSNHQTDSHLADCAWLEKHWRGC